MSPSEVNHAKNKADERTSGKHRGRPEEDNGAPVKALQFSSRAPADGERAVHDRARKAVESEQHEKASAKKPKFGLGRMADGHGCNIIAVVPRRHVSRNIFPTHRRAGETRSERKQEA